MATQDPQQISEFVSDIEKQKPLGQDVPLQGADSEEKDPNIVDWDGDNDPEDPRNWSGKKKWTNAGLIAAFTLITQVPIHLLNYALTHSE